MNSMILLFLVVLLFIIFIVFIFGQYKKCPSNKIMVIYGSVGRGLDGKKLTSRCIHGGSFFVMPIFQGYQFLDLSPISIHIDISKILTKDNNQVSVSADFKVAISTDEKLMQNAAERLLGKDSEYIQSLAQEIIIGQMRLSLAKLSTEEIMPEITTLLSDVSDHVKQELKKIGLELLNANLNEFDDEAGYFKSLTKQSNHINTKIEQINSTDNSTAKGDNQNSDVSKEAILNIAKKLKAKGMLTSEIAEITGVSEMELFKL